MFSGNSGETKGRKADSGLENVTQHKRGVWWGERRLHTTSSSERKGKKERSCEMCTHFLQPFLFLCLAAGESVSGKQQPSFLSDAKRGSGSLWEKREGEDEERDDCEASSDGSSFPSEWKSGPERRVSLCFPLLLLLEESSPSFPCRVSLVHLIRIPFSLPFISHFRESTSFP